MKRVLSKCPGCQGQLKIITLRCEDCGMELRSDFELSVFDQLNDEQYQFLMMFLKGRGSLKDVQAELKMSYPTAEKKLDELIVALGLAEPQINKEGKEMDMSNMNVDYSSKKASEIIKAKLKENGGHATVYTARGLPCEIYAEPDGETFTSDKLPGYKYEYAVFDDIVELMRKQGGTARKGNGFYKLGAPGCEENTITGVVGLSRGIEVGKSVGNPISTIAAMLEWGGIASNGRGVVTLTEEYKCLL